MDTEPRTQPPARVLEGGPALVVALGCEAELLSQLCDRAVREMARREYAPLTSAAIPQLITRMAWWVNNG